MKRILKLIEICDWILVQNQINQILLKLLYVDLFWHFYFCIIIICFSGFIIWLPHINTLMIRRLNKNYNWNEFHLNLIYLVVALSYKGHSNVCLSGVKYFLSSNFEKDREDEDWLHHQPSVSTIYSVLNGGKDQRWL